MPEATRFKMLSLLLCYSEREKRHTDGSLGKVRRVVRRAFRLFVFRACLSLYAYRARSREYSEGGRVEVFSIFSKDIFLDFFFLRHRQRSAQKSHSAKVTPPLSSGTEHEQQMLSYFCLCFAFFRWVIGTEEYSSFYLIDMFYTTKKASLFFSFFS